MSTQAITFDVGVILPAAGSGDRLGGPVPKQYSKILGQPLFLYALEEFVKLTWVKKVSLVVDSPENVKSLLQESNVKKEKVIVVQGERTRHRSIKAGVHELQKSGTALHIFVVHDAVRPFVPTGLLQELVLAAEQHGASGATRPLTSTIIQPDPHGFVKDCLVRTQYVASETPQAFQSDILIKAYNKCSEEDLDHGTECLQLVLSYVGVRAALIPGPAELWKVTYKRDLYAAASCLKEQANHVCVVAAEESPAITLLVDSLKPCVASVHSIVSGGAKPDPTLTFNTIVFFHMHEIDSDSQLLKFTAMVDINKEGLIVHVIEHANAEGMQSTSVYDLHHNGCTMAHQYHKLHKGVVIIHCLSSGEEQRLADLVTTLVASDAPVFSEVNIMKMPSLPN